MTDEPVVLPLRLSARAEHDLDEIAGTISLDNLAAAERVIDAIYDTLTFLTRNPRVGLLREDLARGLRIFPAVKPANSYVVLFREEARCVEIIAVLHGARDWIGMLRRGDV